MDEVQETSEATETNDTTETTDNTATETAETTETSNPEREWVDPAKDSPDKIKARLDFLYGKDKKNERILQGYRAIAAEQARTIEELRGGFGQVVNHITQKNFQDIEANLERDMIAALQKGDTDTYVSAQAKLIDLKADQKLAARQIQPKQQPQQRQPSSASQMAVNMPYEEQSMVNAWQDEQDERGSPVRPWAANSGSDADPDPDYVKAVLTARNVFTNPATAHLTLNQKLAEVDKRMGVKKTERGQTVMGGGLTNKPKTGRITLTPEIEKFAIRSKFGGPKLKTDAERIDAYRKQIEKSRSKQGAR